MYVLKMLVIEKITFHSLFQPTLYLLLTDQGYLQTNAVWETLTDVDSRCSEFVDSNLQPIQQEEQPPILGQEMEMTKEQQISSEYENSLKFVRKINHFLFKS